jgi:hypothetical protein
MERVRRSDTPCVAIEVNEIENSADLPNFETHGSVDVEIGMEVGKILMLLGYTVLPRFMYDQSGKRMYPSWSAFDIFV